MANNSGEYFETEEDRKRQREAIDDMYEGREVSIIEEETKWYPFDFTVTGEGYKHLVEVKARGTTNPDYTLQYFRDRGYKIGMKKISGSGRAGSAKYYEGLVDRARRERATPILLVATYDRYLMAMPAQSIKHVASQGTFERKNRRGEYPEPAWVINPADMSVWPRDIIREFPPGAWNIWTDYGPREDGVAAGT